MAIDNNSGDVITLSEAVTYTHSFQDDNPGAIKAFFVGVNKLNLILQQRDCIGIRMYNAYDADTQKNNLVLVGVDANGDDLANGVILDRAATCPQICPIGSPLLKT